MGLFPQSFLDDLKAQADLVQVVQDYVPLKRAGGSYKGLCPFHSEKTPSFHVNRDKGFFHCFGCGVGGDVFKFLELHGKLGFQESVRLLASRFGLPVPEIEMDAGKAAADAEREELLKLHELAADYYRECLTGRLGARARQQLERRGLARQTLETLQLGFAPASREGLKDHLLQHGFSLPQLVRSGLVVQREAGAPIDRFRNRLMVPICRESGSIIAFGGRAVELDQLPKYLNSPETAIYSKGWMLYGLHLTKAAIRRQGFAVLVEGYFDFAQALQAGVTTVVASCGTALSLPQAQLLRRFATKAILSFDPDAAGAGASARTGELLLSQGFQVNVAVLPAGEDPDTFVRRQGGARYLEKLRSSLAYLEYLLERTAVEHDFSRDDSRREFLGKMLTVAACIPDAATRDQFGDRLAHKARITEEVVRAEIKKAAVSRRTTVSDGELGARGEIRTAEKGLIWALLHAPEAAVAALGDLEDGALDELATGPILKAARSLGDWPADTIPATLRERLNASELQLVASIAAQDAAPAPVDECAHALTRLRYERERAALQSEINHLQELGTAQHMHQIDELWKRKKNLLYRIEALST